MFGYCKLCLFAKTCCLNIWDASLLVLTKQIQAKHNNDKNAFTFHSRLINLYNIKFTEEQINTLLGPNYSLEKEPKQYIKEVRIKR